MKDFSCIEYKLCKTVSSPQNAGEPGAVKKLKESKANKMKTTLQSKPSKAAIKFVASVIPRRPSLPILSTIRHVNIMKTKTRKTTLPKSYDAGVCTAGKSIGFTENLTPEQVAAVFSKHKKVMHIETPAGYFLRNEDGLTEGNPYTIPQVITNLMEAENQLRKFPCNLTGGAGWVRNQLRAIVMRGIGPDFQSTLEAVKKLAQQNRLAVFDIKTKSLVVIKSEGGGCAACQNGDSIQINLQR